MDEQRIDGRQVQSLVTSHGANQVGCAIPQAKGHPDTQHEADLQALCRDPRRLRSPHRDVDSAFTQPGYG